MKNRIYPGHGLRGLARPVKRRAPTNQVGDLVAIAVSAGVTPAQFAAIAKEANYDRRIIEIILEGLK